MPVRAITRWRQLAAAASIPRGDMMRWMQQYLSSDFYQRSNRADRMQTLIYQRAQFTKVIGMDVPGKADALGLGWYIWPRKRVVRGLFRRQAVVAVSLPIWR